MLLHVNSEMFILSRKPMLFFDARMKPYIRMYTAARRRRLFVLLTAGDRMSDLHGFVSCERV